MKDEEETKPPRLKELEEARWRVAELETAVAERKWVEEALRESEKYYRALVEAGGRMGEAVIVLQNTDKIEAAHLFANQEWTRMTGYSAEELKEISYLDLVHPRYRNMVADRLRRRSKGEDVPGRYEISIVARDGTEVPMEAAGTNIDYQGKPTTVAYIRDITNRRKAEEKIRQLSHAVEQCASTVVITNVKGDIVYVNPRFTETTGYSPEEALGQNPRILKSDKKSSEEYKELWETITSGRDWRGEFHNKKKNGEIYWETASIAPIKNPEGVITHFIAVKEDITERKRMEETLAKHHDHLEELVKEGTEELQRNYDTQTTLNALLHISLLDISLEEQLRLILGHILSIPWLAFEKRGAIFLVEDEPEVLVMKAQSGLDKPHQKTCTRIPFGKCVCGRAALTRQIEFTDRLDDRHEIRYEGITPHGHYCAPVLSADKVLGVINMYLKEGHRRDKKEEEFLTAVANTLVGIINRKKAEEALQESEERFSKAFHLGPGAMVITRIDDGKFIVVSDVFTRMYGYHHEKIIGQTALEIGLWSKLEQRDKMIRTLRKNGVVRNLEVEFRTKSGEIRNVLFSAELIDLEDEKCMVAVTTDITKRKQAEEALKRSNEFLNTILDSMNDPISIIDVHDFKIVEVNDAFLKQYGVKEEEVIGKECYQITHHRSDPCVPPDDICPLLDTVTSGKPSVAEHVHYGADGEKVYVEVSTSPVKDENGKVIQVVHVAKDITQRKKSEEEIAKFKTASDLANFGITMLDGERIITYVNKTCAELHGYRPEELIGKHCTLLVPEAHVEVVERLLEKSANTGGFTNEEVTPKRKDGTIFPALMTGITVKDDSGTPVYTSIILIDLTERKKMEEQLMVTDRLASIGELASGIAHELNNPLTGVIGLSELVLAGDLPADVKEDLEIINREAQRTARIVKNLLTFARKHPQEKQSVDINRAVEKVLELRAYEQKVNNIEVDTRFAPDLPEITADSFQLQQVFLNIVINAEHFMIEAHGRGTLTITTERVGDIVRASFADDGPGIARENIGHLFDPFFTTKEVGKGTGLGLSISYGIITEHDGRIYAESELGKGATFIVELPVNRK